MHRLILKILVLLTAGWAVAGAAASPYDEICERARVLAGRPFEAATNKLAEQLTKLSYDQMRDIVFRREKALWSDERLPYKIEFFHPGGLHHDVVTIHQIENDRVSDIGFSPSFFSYGSNHLADLTAPGFAGFKILIQERSQEIAAFLDASYFRLVGLGQTYGTSARGLAINTTDLGHEEFPAFREFWLCKPRRSDKDLTVFALLDSPSVAGAFKFVIEGGTKVIATVTATFFPRKEIREFGIAPLTSMFWFDENSRQDFRDFRPEVHDADGLLRTTGDDEWSWRPFESRRMARFNVYSAVNPRGFGILQRDRNFEHYADLVATYQARPDIWIKPLGNWGEGALTLVQLPTDTEFTDNIVTFWVPKMPPKPGESLTVVYRLEGGTNHITPKSLGEVLSTRVATVGAANTGNLRFVIEFAGGELASLARHGGLKSEVHCRSAVTNLTHTLMQNDFNHTQRLVIEMERPAQAVDLAARLVYDGRPVTEIWNYTWQP